MSAFKCIVFVHLFCFCFDFQASQSFIYINRNPVMQQFFITHGFKKIILKGTLMIFVVS